MDSQYLVRERALQMAQSDFLKGAIALNEVVQRAAEYEAYLLHGAPPRDAEVVSE